MPLRARTRAPTAPPAWWGLFASWLALTAPQAARLWHLVSTSHNPTIRTWVVTAVYAAGHVQGREQCVALVRGPLKPDRVIAVLEALVTDRHLTRLEATAMEEAILTATTAAGLWT